MKYSLKIISAILLFGFLFNISTAFAQDENSSPAGFWQTIDDKTKEPKAIVEIKENNGEFTASIVKTFRKPEDKQTCEACPGDKKDKPYVGMEILWGLKKDGDQYTGGSILDPNNGKTYKAKMTLVEKGAKLEVKGYIGVPLLGRTQTWNRTQAP